MKVTIYGGTNNKEYTKAEIACSERLGTYLASRGAQILTGACRGFPRYVGRAAIAGGSTVIGYSPGIDEKDHIERFKFPLDGCTKIEFIGRDGMHMADNFLKRSMDMNDYADICIALGGSWGTYTELLISFWYKKTIILVKGFGGAVEQFYNTYKFFDERETNPAVHQGAEIIVVDSVDEVISILESKKFS